MTYKLSRTLPILFLINRWLKRCHARFAIALYALVFMSVGFHGFANATEPYSRMEEITGRLLMNTKKLEHIYQDMHDYAQWTMNRSDRQVDYIQKSYLFINEAKTIAFYQWELMSVFDYIKDERKADYITLRYRDLRQAIDDTNLTIHLLNTYVMFIEKPEVKQSIEEAVGLIQGNTYMYEELRNLLRPLSNKPQYPYEIEK